MPERLKCTVPAMLLLALLGFGCSENEAVESSAVVKPIPGGGSNGRKIAGELTVFVSDSAAGVALAGAEVFVGEGQQAVSVGLADASGRVVVRDPSLQGPQVVSVRANGFVAQCWLGVSANVVTIPLIATNVVTKTATVRGTIKGWSNAAAPASGEYRVALVDFAREPDLNSSANAVAQEGTSPLTKNTCLHDSSGAACDFELRTRSGTLRLFAVLLEGKDAGTPADFSDDSVEMVGFALSDEVTVVEGQVLSGTDLSPLSAGQLTTASIGVGVPPALFNKVVGVPGLTVGGGVLVYPEFPSLPASFLVPRKQDVFADAVLWAVGTARPDSGAGRSTVLLRGQALPSDGTAVTLQTGAFLEAPQVSLDAETLDFTPPAGASLLFADVAGATPALSVFVLDGRTLVRPPSALVPSGPVTVTARAVDAPFSAAEFSLPDLAQSIEREVEAQVTGSL